MTSDRCFGRKKLWMWRHAWFFRAFGLCTLTWNLGVKSRWAWPKVWSPETEDSGGVFFALDSQDLDLDMLAFSEDYCNLQLNKDPRWVLNFLLRVVCSPTSGHYRNCASWNIIYTSLAYRHFLLTSLVFPLFIDLFASDFSVSQNVNFLFGGMK